MKFRSALGLAIMAIAASLGQAQTTTNLIVTPSSPAFPTGGNQVNGVSLDAAPGNPYGSLAQNGGTAKSEAYFTPESLFGGREVTVGEVESMSYWTKTGATHTADPRDWFLVVYTKRYTGQVGSNFYGVRIGTEPYFSENLTDPANTWNQWSSNGPINHLRFFESTYNYFGSYTDAHWSNFITGTSLAGSRGPGVPYATQPILYFSTQTATAWTSGFTGQIDGLRIKLTDGSVANINFEPFAVATQSDACKKGGWMSLFRANGTSFMNQGDCIQYVNTGK